MEVVLGRGRDEVVVVTRMKLQSTGGGRERAESDGEIHQLMRPIAQRHDLGSGLRDSTRVVLLFGDTVNDVLLLIFHGDTRFVDGTHNVHLIVLPRVIATVDLDHVIRWGSKHGIGCIPMNGMDLGRGRTKGVAHETKKK